MGLYRERILAVLVDRACGTAGLRRWRAELPSGLSGRVLGIGSDRASTSTTTHRAWSGSSPSGPPLRPSGSHRSESGRHLWPSSW